MSKPSARKRSIAVISFGNPQLLKRALARSAALHGARGFSRYIRQVVQADLAASNITQTK